MRLWQQRSSKHAILPSPVRHTSTGLPAICSPFGSSAGNSLERPATNQAFSITVSSGIARSFARGSKADFRRWPCWAQDAPYFSPELGFQLELRDRVERGRNLVQQALGALVELLGSPAAFRPCAGLEVGAQAPRAGDAAPAELAAQEVVALQRRFQVVRVLLDRFCEADRVERGLGDAHADMRARDERGVAEEARAPDRKARRLDVEDSLKERLRALEHLGHVRREQCPCIALHLCDDAGTKPRVPDPAGMMAT